MNYRLLVRTRYFILGMNGAGASVHTQLVEFGNDLGQAEEAFKELNRECSTASYMSTDALRMYALTKPI